MTDALDEWEQSVGARLTLQADLTWSGGQDGYVDAGWADSANPYQTLWWDLEPLASHCEDCPDVAAASPYDAPGSGGNELGQTPGDGQTACGAACKCALRYGAGQNPPPAQDMKSWLPSDLPTDVGVPAGPMIPTTPAPAPPATSGGSPAIPGGEFNAGQKKALDTYRVAELTWNAVRGPLPELPNFFTLANPNWDGPKLPSWETLTREQQQALELAFEAFAVWQASAPEDVFGDEEFGFGEYPRRSNRRNHRDRDADADGDGETIRLYNPNHDPHTGEFTTGGAGAGAGSGSEHQEKSQRVARLGKAQARYEQAQHAHQTAHEAHQRASQRTAQAQARMRGEEARLRTVQAKVIEQTRAQVIAERAAKSPKAYERYQSAQKELIATQAAVKSHEQAVQHAYETMGRIEREVNAQHPDGFRSDQSYRAALRQHADYAQHQAAAKLVKEQNARQVYAYHLSSKATTAEKQLIGNRLDPTSARIQNHPDMVAQRTRLQRATNAYQKAAAQGRETYEAVNRAGTERELARINLEAAHSASGVSIHYGDVGERGSQAELSRIFGRALSDHEVASLAGAHEGDVVHVHRDLIQLESGRDVSVVNLSMTSSRDGSTNDLNVERTAAGEIVIHHGMVENSGTKSISTGREVVEGLRNWQRLGVTRLEATAGRSDATHGIMRTRMNGYDTWAKLGFVGKIPTESSRIGQGHKSNILHEAQARFGKHITRVEQLMRLGAAARQWWKENGDDWHATFSFKPNSYSMRTLEKYEAVLNRHGAAQSSAAPSKKGNN